MTLRALELQIAIPRMQDIGKIQEHLKERPQQEQMNLSLEREQKDEVNRTRVAKAEEAVESRVARDGKQGADYRGQDEAKKRRRKKKFIQSEKQNLHPYKGHSLDISL
ncbi:MULTISPECIES: hypothetical protein [Aneurinibacillus]|uniref:Uncharacterized protein n=1 Tax=Aneurinibacillus thermoaerophilus TaxID=143495 RepID=A0A1G7WFF2_ANETH|nr:MULTISPECIES: hypothetical protein [Aneurinibacillus]AMA72694.1 hypothetical protein ACH33_07400 [Aneurinibacillus sp. XH2]MED0674586.1 hypothetical protein [Aneurinibacillus thermoaerophilus]MED0677955.1 hypothetical protein [Aneurinibacillus thermoaerophilus]MED0736982.1 hypothetical protein [Aneurinibacillus thermoaerophilus]MED0756823.1 hypothetical protein [Aneurinibacillus thermoaerophilus]